MPEPGGSGGPPIFGRSVNPTYSNWGGQIIPTYYNWHPQCFSPSGSTVHNSISEEPEISNQTTCVITYLLIPLFGSRDNSECIIAQT